MYETILIPTDGSDAADGAVDRALELAETYGATVHALYAVRPVYTVEDGLDRVYAALEADGERATSEIAERAAEAGVDAVTEVRRGPPHSEILDYVDEHGVDLVVMGTHGRTGLDRYLLGSVTEKVVRLADVPVLTVRTPAEED
jgi:nucleotide-binding universal stress UspA family protein